MITELIDIRCFDTRFLDTFANTSKQIKLSPFPRVKTRLNNKIIKFIHSSVIETGFN